MRGGGPIVVAAFFVAGCREEGPVGRYSHVGVIDAADESLAIVGGASSDGKLADAWRFDLDRLRWERLPDAPEVLFRATAVRGEGDDVWVFGGTDADGLESDRLYRWSLADGTWTAVTPAGDEPWPAPRYKAAATWRDGRMVVHGGRTAGGGTPVVYADLWAWDPTTRKWTDLGEPGGAVYRQGLCTDEAGAVWWSGGIDGDEVRGGGLARLDPGAVAFAPVTWEGEDPGVRASHSFVCGADGPVVWGGTGQDTAVWRFDPSGEEWSAIDAAPAPVARDAQVTALRQDHVRIIVMGGDTADPELPDFIGDVWSFDGAEWTQLADG